LIFIRLTTADVTLITFAKQDSLEHAGVYDNDYQIVMTIGLTHCALVILQEIRIFRYQKLASDAILFQSWLTNDTSQTACFKSVLSAPKFGC
jgi:hypothetical protein